MSLLPLPAAHARALAEPATNTGLRLDKGFDRYERDWTVTKADRRTGRKEGKQAFLLDFVKLHAGAQGRYPAFLERRCQALTALKAREIRLTTATRLEVGLGLPSPLETGFLLDRLTGCPYLPGSSVKGLLRATAELVGKGEIEQGDRAFWSHHLARIFGPETGADSGPAKGEAAFFDAWPAVWPKLEVEILTPHHQDWNGDKPGSLPADSDDPVPVPFLTVAAGTPYLFFFRSLAAPERAAADLAQVEALLPIALDWLGIGGKTSSGYGYFGGEALAAERPAPRARSEREEWKNVTLELIKNKTQVRAIRSPRDPTATAEVDAIEDARVKLRNTFAKGDVTVEKTPEGSWKLVSVRWGR